MQQLQTPKKKLIPKRVKISELDPVQRRRNFDEVAQPYTREEAILEAQRCVQCARAWCVEACPILEDCREYIRLIAIGDFDGALQVILRDNPLASCLGRICYRYCEDVCVVAKKGDPVAIKQLKRAAIDFATKKEVYEPVPKIGKKVAVVGAGPAGIMAAWVLSQKGYDVTVFEAHRILGGLMTLSIPRYRFPEDVFKEDMRRMKKLGVKFKTNVKVGRDLSLEELFKQGFEAVFIGIGTHLPQKLKIPGLELKGVHYALEFLKKICLGERVEIGKRVAVIGGGDVAVDSVRSATRLGAERVILVYRRSRNEMPADSQEIKEAEDEGIELMFLTAPVKILGKKNVEGLECQRMELGPPDESGRRSPVPIPGSYFVLDVDTVIIAIGQSADLQGLPELGLKISKDGVTEADPKTGATLMPGVFAGGGKSVVHAMAAGKRAALAIDEYLKTKVPA